MAARQDVRLDQVKEEHHLSLAILTHARARHSQLLCQACQQSWQPWQRD